jgi:hypothetical protein
MKPINDNGWYDCWKKNQAWRKNAQWFDTIESTLMILIIGLALALIVKHFVL